MDPCHKCKNPRLFLIEEVDDDGDNEAEVSTSFHKLIQVRKLWDS